MLKNILRIYFLICITGTLPAIDKSTLIKASFDSAMEPVGKYSKEYLESHSLWTLAKDLYTEQIVDNLQYSPTPLIPKIIHQIWLGSEFPEKYRAWQATWKKMHPDWHYILWTDKDIEKLKLVNKKMYDRAPNYGEKSDIARYEILYRFGGLYIDTDFECIKPFDILHHCCEFYVGINEIPNAAYNGIIGSVPHHPLLKRCIKNMRRDENATDTTTEIVARTGPIYFTEILRQYLPRYSKNVVLFPTTFFYAWPWFHRFENQPEQIAQWIRPESMAIHHWEVSWNGGKGVPLNID